MVNNMLILNRKLGETIIIGENIEVKILEVQDGKVKIGIEAPKDISILRKEIYDAVIEENQKSLESQVDILEILKRK